MSTGSHDDSDFVPNVMKVYQGYKFFYDPLVSMENSSLGFDTLPRSSWLIIRCKKKEKKRKKLSIAFTLTFIIAVKWVMFVLTAALRRL